MRGLVAVPVLLVTLTSAAYALPFATDPRCPNVNAAVASLEQQEAAAPQNESTYYLQVAQAYEKCMQAWVQSGNSWQAYWAGTHAMEWAAGAATLADAGTAPGATGSSQVASEGYALVHRDYQTMQNLGLSSAQYGDEWDALDTLARQKLGIGAKQ